MAGLFGSLTDALGITQYSSQEQAMQNALNQFTGLTVPEIQDINLSRFEKVGEFSPELYRAEQAGPSAFGDIYVDPRLKQAQLDALTALEQQGVEGLTAQDRLMLEKIAQDEATKSRGAREAIIQQAAARGVGGSGLELMQQMINQQESAGRQSMRDMEVAALREQAKREALQQAGQLGGQMRGQEFGEQAQAAEAKDILNRFNVTNKQQAGMTNVQAQNLAKQQELAERRRIEELNKQQKDKEEMWKAGAPMQQFQAGLGLAGQKAGAYGNQAGMYSQQSQTGLGGAQGAASAAAMIAMASDKNVKKDIELAPELIDDFLSELTGYKYSYKDPEKYGKGERLGVMAQDMDKSRMGKEATLIDGEGVERIDPSKALSAILASVGRLNDRIDQLEENKNA
jgi:hypothetical protein